MRTRRPAVHSLRALGRHDPPAAVRIDGASHNRHTIFKHDFFAATSLYESAGGQIVIKVGRRTDCLGLPLAWIGKLSTGHEVAVYRHLDGLEGIPPFIGRTQPDVLAHRFVPGHTLQRNEAVGESFFPQLEALLDTIHARDVAYVDLEKRENIIVGDDGRPYLIDFQISLHVPPGRGPVRSIARWILARFQQSDRYHLLKHWRRHRPDQLSPEQIARSRRAGIWIQLHRTLTKPLVRLRRRTLSRVAKPLPDDAVAAPAD